MYLKEYLEQFKDKRIKLFIDMDGVIVDYVFNSAKDYDQKRPLYDNIKKIEEISKMKNVELYIFSATRYSEGYNQKQWWLDTFAPFFKKENRIILSREDNNMKESSLLKAEYLENLERDDSILIVIDDDPKNLKDIHRLNNDVILLKDTVLDDDTAIKYMNITNQLFMELARAYPSLSWKKKVSNDEFLIGINTPNGIIGNKYKIEYWDEINILEINEEYAVNDLKDNSKTYLKSLNKR